MRGLGAASFFAAARLGRASSSALVDDLAGRLVDGGRVLGLGLLDVRTEAAVLDDDELAVLGVLAEHAVAGDGRVDELLRLLGGQLVGREVFGDVDAARRGLGIRGVDHVEVRPVLAEAQRRRVADARGVELARVDLAEVLDDVAQTRLGVGAEVELLQPVGALLLAAGDRVEVVLERGGEVVVDEVGEVLLEQPDDAEREPARHERLTALGDVAAIEDHVDDARERRRAADALLLERLDEARLGVARLRGGRVTLGLDLLEAQRVADGEHRQRLVVGLVGVAALLVAALFVGLEEALEGVDGAGCRELGALPLRRRSTASVTVVVSYFASDIWLAIVRFQMRSYMRCSSRSSSPETDAGVRNCSPDGRIASCASCAFLLLLR